jgi:hypothetical protein
MAQGTGLPLPKNDLVLTRESPIIDGDKYSSAKAWTQIANEGAQLAKSATDALEIAVKQRQVGWVAQADNDDDAYTNRARDEFLRNPNAKVEEFESSFRGYMEGKLGESPGWDYDRRKRYLGGKMESTYAVLSNHIRTRDEQLNRQQVNARSETAANDIVGLAGAGKVGTPEWEAATTTYRAVLDSAVSTRLMAPEAAERAMDATMGRAYGENAAREGVLIYNNQGYEAAVEHLRVNIRDNENLKLKLGEKQAAFARGLSAINLQRRVDYADRGGIVDDVKNTVAEIKASIPVEPERVVRLLDAAKHVRAWGAYRDLQIEYGTKQFTDALESAPPAARAAIIGGARGDVAEAALLQRESGGNPAVVNRFGYAGLYQFGAPRLQSIGVYQKGQSEDFSQWSKTARDAPGKWSGTFTIEGFPDVKTFEDFLRNPDAQRAVRQIDVQRMDNDITAQGLDRFVGQTVGGVPITREGIRNMMHLGGVYGAKYFLESDGRTNAADANGTTVGDYARMASRTASGDVPGLVGVPHASIIVKRAQQYFAQQTKKDWPEFKQQAESGKEIDPDDFNAIRMAAAVSGDAHWQKEVETVFAAHTLNRRIQALGPVSTQQASVDQLRGQFDDKVIGIVQGRLDRDLKMLADDQVGYALDRGSRAPMPLNIGDSAQFRAGLQERGNIARSVAQSQHVTVGNVLRPAELAALQSALAVGDVRTKARIYGDLASLPEDVRMPTLAKLGAQGPAAMAQSFAGGLYASAPDVAESVLRGRQAIAADERLDPTKSGNKSDFNASLDKLLPAAAFTVAGRTSSTGAYATVRNAVVARYADLSAQAADTSGTLNEHRVQQAVDDVTGGTVRHNGAPIIAPQRGMRQDRFDAIVWSLKDTDLADATTLNGSPVTADYLRNRARLESVGDGRYLVVLNSNPAAPQYAVRNANTESPSPYVLDLRNRNAGSMSFTRDGYPVVQ